MSTINPFAEFSLSRGLDSVTHLKTENTPKTVDFFNLDL